MNLDKLLYNLHSEGENLHKNGRDHEYIWSCESVAVQALNSLGLAYSTYAKNYEKALKCLYNALDIDRGNWLIWSNLTHIYSVIDDKEKAIKCAYKSIECSRGEVLDPYYNAGVVLAGAGRLLDAENMYRAARQLNSNHDFSAFNLGLLLLRQAKFEEGWDFYEWRFRTAELTGNFKKRFIQEEWDGRKFKKKSLVVYSEQGLGDFIMFSRFLPKVQSLGGKVIVEVQEPLVNLIKENFKDVEVISRENSNNWPKAPKSDYAISICSLPRVLKIYNADDVKSDPYIKATIKTKAKAVRSKKIKVGLCWSGNPDHRFDYNRSIPVKLFSKLINHSKVECYSLNKSSNAIRNWSTGTVDLDEGRKSLKLVDLSDKIKDFSDLAREIENMDLVITVDTGLAHLCGAMGKATWVLLGSETDWRWMDNSNTSPWYDSITLFRYNKSWETTIDELVKVLPFKG